METLHDTWYWLRHKSQLRVWHEVVGVYALVWLVWGMYRTLSPLPVVIEELVLKGLVLGGAVGWVGVHRHKMSFFDLGLRVDNLFQSVYLGLGLGLTLGVVATLANMLRHGGIQFDNYGLRPEMVGGFLLLAMVTAFWECLFFYGFMLQRLRTVCRELIVVGVTASLYAFLHVPVLLMVERMGWSEMTVALILLFCLGIANAILMLRMKNLAAPILTQVVWGVTVFLFR